MKYLKASNYGWFGFELPCGAAPPRLQDSSSDDELPRALRRAAPRSRMSRLQANQLALARQRAERPSRVRFSSQLMPPTNAQQRAPSYDWQQAQAPKQAQAQAPSYDWQQAQAAIYHTQNPVYADATNYPQQTAQPPSIYPGYQYGRSPNPGAHGNGRNYETITVGYAFIHHMLADEVPARSLPSNAVVYKPETSSKENNLRLGYSNICGAQGGHSALPEQHRKGKEPMRLESSLEQLRSRYGDRILHSIRPARISLDPASNSSCCQLEEVTVTESSESRSEGCVSELHQAVVPCEEELPAEKGSQGSDTASSECYGSPLSDIYEDVPQTASPCREN